MEEIAEIDADSTAGQLTVVKSFLKHLDNDEKEEFEAISRQLGDEFEAISPIQRGFMAVCIMIQAHLIGKGYAATKGEAELSADDKDLLDWARKMYDSNVNRIYNDRKMARQQSSVVEILKKWRRENDDWDEDGPVFGKTFEKVSISDIEFNDSVEKEGENGQNDGHRDEIDVPDDETLKNSRRYREDGDVGIVF